MLSIQYTTGTGPCDCTLVSLCILFYCDVLFIIVLLVWNSFLHKNVSRWLWLTFV